MTGGRQSSPSLPWLLKISMSLLTTFTDAARRADGTLNRPLANFIDVKASANAKPVNGVKTLDVAVDTSRNLWFRLFVPTAQNDGAALPVIVFFHGGGFVFLGADSRNYDAVCRRFARKFPAIIVSVNYRLTPEHRLPCQYDDGFDVLKFLDGVDGRRSLPENADLARCFLAGDSAGGNICHHVALRACGANFRKVKIVGLVSIQPFFGGEERTESELQLVGLPLVSVDRTDWMWKALLPAGADRDHEAVNVCGPNSPDISRLDYPPTLMFVGGWDPLKDWQRRYYEWLKAAGKEAQLVEYPNAIHAFYIFPVLPESSLLITEVRDFIHRHPHPVT